MSGIIAYQNLLESAATVTASSAASTGPARNAWDGIGTTYWEPVGTGDHTLTAEFDTPVTADCFAFFRQNLASAGGSLVLQYSADAGANWIDCFAPLTPADDDCRLQTFTAVASTHWRILASITTAPLYLGVLLFGERLTLYRGLPLGSGLARQARETEVITNKAEGGITIGRSVIRRGARQEIQAQYVPAAWVRSHWEPFIRHAERKPFFYSWHNTVYPEDCVYGDADMPLPRVVFDEFGLQNLRLTMSCQLSGVQQ